MTSEISLAIADDHHIFKQGVASLIKFTPDINLVLNSNNGKELLESIKIKQPDVVLLDLKMPVMDGLTALPILKEKYPKVKVIILSLIDDHSTIKKALKNGADAFLSKNADPDLIFRTIRECYKRA